MHEAVLGAGFATYRSSVVQLITKQGLPQNSQGSRLPISVYGFGHIVSMIEANHGLS